MSGGGLRGRLKYYTKARHMFSDEQLDRMLKALDLLDKIESTEYEPIWHDDSDWERGYNSCLKEIKGYVDDSKVWC